MKPLLTLILLITATQTTFSQDKNELLLKAVADGDKEAVVQLIKEGADVNYVKTVGAWMKMNPLITAITNKHFDIARVLIENNTDVNWKDGFNTSAILYAASSGNRELVALLLSHGADINDHDGQGNTVLTAAKESKNKDLINFVKKKVAAEK